MKIEEAPIDHWYWLAEFCRLERQAGGPDPHMRVVEHLSKGEDAPEKFWRAGCYVALYNVPSAEELWQEFPWQRAARDPNKLVQWIHAKNRKAITTRPERRCVISALKLSTCLVDYTAWLETLNPQHLPKDRHKAYEQLWEELDDVGYMGRYAKFKLLEILERFGVPISLPDLRPAGGWSPRLTLALLYPNQAQELAGDNRPETLRAVNAAAEQAQLRLAEQYNVALNLYELEVLLCDYRQLGRRQFPGHSQDSELKYALKTDAYRKHPSHLFTARAKLFPHEHLGELQGWIGNGRKELSYTLLQHGYLWSDSLFEYGATTDLANPVRR